MPRSSSRTALVFGLSLMGCYGGEVVLAREPPALSTCTYGAAWADCAGGDADAAAVFACTGCNDPLFGPCCLWFARGVVAEGFEASACPEDDACCVATTPAHAGSPYVDVDTALSQAIAHTTVAWGRAAWDDQRERNVDVVLAAPMTGPTSYTCSATSDEGPCRAGAVVDARALGSSGALAVLVRDTSDALSFERLSIEAFADGARAARICRVGATDAAFENRCEVREPRCATEGTLTLPTLDPNAALTFDLTATFADGTTIDAHF